ncbi:class E sortase [Conexibacter sp. SYSU D00693]|uniref:class E sortase n=1 Tax=Conexibacter sp. SYSU D00693 TaxID=2812560 RepID=UPI00196B7B71|nr:class E sortase [Conexibacter sp. SYSU D00693]
MRARLVAAWTLLLAGGALLADGVLTVVWQEPVSAVREARAQDRLRDELAATERLWRPLAARPARVEPLQMGSPLAAVRTAALPGLATRPRGLALPAVSARALPALTGEPERARDVTLPVTGTDALPPLLRGTPAQAGLRALAQRFGATLAEGAAAGRLRIDRLDLDVVVVQGVAEDDLRRGPGHYAQTALPGQGGTVAIAGHRTTYGAPLRHADRLRRGDRIDLHMPYGTFRYRVEGTRIVRPDDATVLRRRPGAERLVLTTCHPLHSAAQRLVVVARRAG